MCTYVCCTYVHSIVCWRDRPNTENHHNKQKATKEHAIDQGDLNAEARLKVMAQNVRGQYKLVKTNEYRQIKTSFQITSSFH